jgi:CDP-paratose 2-epimerase
MKATTNGKARKVLITGGAGFIGSNLAARLLQKPETHLVIFDNLSRVGAEINLEWLKSKAHKGQMQIVRGDIRDTDALTEYAHGVDEIYHFAAQVAVTTSIENPREDFEINAQGTLNVLEAARKSGKKPFMLFTSTNKVYGALSSESVVPGATAYNVSGSSFMGFDESTLLDFHSPYGCSKGAADQYVRDYARIYQLPAVVFRMSCIAGPRQLGNEDQGWVAHFLYSIASGREINIYGNGLQVRDILHVHDLIDAMQAVQKNLSITCGQVYNVGGGVKRAFSVLEIINKIERMTKKHSRSIYSDQRPGDQALYISNTNKLEKHTGWKARRNIRDILEDIYKFWKANHYSVPQCEYRGLKMLKEEAA